MRKKPLNEQLLFEDYINWDYEEYSDIDDDYEFEETKSPKKSDCFFKKIFCFCLMC